jgi:DNA-binding MarR family transcriptional regulator
MATSPSAVQRSKMIGYLTDAIRDAATALDAAQTVIGKELGLSCEQWSALAVIGRTTRLLSITQLAWQLRHSRQSTYNLAVRLERSGWIRFLRNSEDRRLLQIEITAAGKIILDNANARRSAWLITLTYDLGNPELYVLMNRMRALHNRIARARKYA